MQKIELKKQEMMAKIQIDAKELALKAAELQQKGQIEQAKILQSQREAMLNVVTVMINSGQGRPKES